MRAPFRLLIVMALLIAMVGAAQVAQADAGKAATAKKCKRKHHRKKCRKAAPVTTVAPPSTTTTTTAPPSLHTLTVASPSHGTVTSSPAGIACPGDCSEVYPAGQVVTLTPNPELHYALDHWSGDCSGSGTCQVTMDSDRSVAAAFALEMHTLTVQVTSNGGAVTTDGGTVTSDTGGISCRQSGGTCSAQYPYGTTVTLTETPDPAPWTFGSWTGCTPATPTTCTVTVTGSPFVVADFWNT